MDTQNTPIHLKLWHREFWFLSIANMLMSISIYMMIIDMLLVLPLSFSPIHSAVIMGAFAVGLFLPGPFVSFLVQRYPRRRVCTVSLWLLVVIMLATYYAQTSELRDNFWLMFALRLLLGADYGLSQMVLSSTLVVDAVESFQRTEANHHFSWFGRFALSLGPICALLAYKSFAFQGIVFTASALTVLSILFIYMVEFPFKAPDDDVRVFSLDRFFLPRGFVLFLNLFLITCVVGMVITLPLKLNFYAFIMMGFLLAILSEKYVFANADLRSEAVTGLIAMGMSLLIILYRNESMVGIAMAATLMGFGIGIIGSRFLLFFLKLSRHCQRGTSQSTYFLAWESGISCGIFVGLAWFSHNPKGLVLCCIALTAFALLFYSLFVHKWNLIHKNR